MEKTTKIWISGEQKELFDELRIMFMIFEELSFQKNKKQRAQTNLK